MNSSVLWLLNDVLSLKTDVNVSPVRNKQKKCWKKLSGTLFLTSVVDPDPMDIKLIGSWIRNRKKYLRGPQHFF